MKISHALIHNGIIYGIPEGTKVPEKPPGEQSYHSIDEYNHLHRQYKAAIKALLSVAVRFEDQSKAIDIVRNSAIGKAEAVFNSQLNKTQKALFEQIQILLNKLELNAQGGIIQNQANRAVLAKTSEYFNKAFYESGYYSSLGGFVNDILAITAANDAYFTTILDTFTIEEPVLKK